MVEGDSSACLGAAVIFRAGGRQYSCLVTSCWRIASPGVRDICKVSILAPELSRMILEKLIVGFSIRSVDNEPFDR